MNRPIKFRVYNTKQNKWIHGPGNEVNLFGETILLGGFMQNVPTSELNDCVALQYTGLTDINGKEIYEGDILKIHYDVGGDVIGQVLYEADHGGYIFQWKRKGPNQHHINLNCDVAFESVIVGNILENPELLN
jgi:uncharacterized phage protein (TIGR01671 family)